MKIFQCIRKPGSTGPDPCEGGPPNRIVDISGTSYAATCNNDQNEKDKGWCVYQDDGSCNVECIAECIDGNKVHTTVSPGRIFSPCYCEGDYRYSGSCISTTDPATGQEKHLYTEFTCEGVDSCIDYYDDQVQGITSDVIKLFCETDYCDVEANGCEVIDAGFGFSAQDAVRIKTEQQNNPELKDTNFAGWLAACVLK